MFGPSRGFLTCEVGGSAPPRALSFPVLSSPFLSLSPMPVLLPVGVRRIAQPIPAVPVATAGDTDANCSPTVGPLFQYHTW